MTSLEFEGFLLKPFTFKGFRDFAKIVLETVSSTKNCKILQIAPHATNASFAPIWMEGDIAWIRLDKGCAPIHRDTFKDILAAQQEIEERGDDRENIETRTHQNQPLTLVPVQNVPHAYEVFYLGQPLGYVYRSLLLGGWSNDTCKSSFVDPFDAAERAFLDWQVERELGFTLPY